MKQPFQNELSQTLFERYEEILGGQGYPDWAWCVRPAVPYVGTRYTKGGILLYASAENLDFLSKPPEERPDRDLHCDGPVAPLRHYEWKSRYDKGSAERAYFANVGIEPVSNGGLVIAAYFLSKKFNLPTHADPREFLEGLAAANWCKFSIQQPKNKDYVGDLDKLRRSLPYVITDLSVLAPGIVLLPKKAWDHPALRQEMQKTLPNARFLPAYQFQPRPINCHLKRKYAEEAQALEAQHADDDVLLRWIELKKVPRLGKAGVWVYLAHLNEIAENTGGSGRLHS